jgi:hypothetical protein
MKHSLRTKHEARFAAQVKQLVNASLIAEEALIRSAWSAVAL